MVHFPSFPKLEDTPVHPSRDDVMYMWGRGTNPTKSETQKIGGIKQGANQAGRQSKCCFAQCDIDASTLKSSGATQVESVMQVTTFNRNSYRLVYKPSCQAQGKVIQVVSHQGEKMLA